jgi:hypothetical protein
MSVTRFRLSIGALIQVYFKGMVAQFGWGFFGFGMIFALIFANVNTVMGIFMSPEWQRTKGQVTFVEETGASEGDEMVIKQHFSFIGPDGISYDNHSYSTGHYIEEGQQVTVEYDSTNPEIARIEGNAPGVIRIRCCLCAYFPTYRFNGHSGVSEKQI